MENLGAIQTARSRGRRASSGAQRQRRYRQRRRLGAVIIPVAIDEYAVVDALIEAGILDEDESADRSRVAVALERIVGDWAKNTVTRHAHLGLCRGMVRGPEEYAHFQPSS